MFLVSLESPWCGMVDVDVFFFFVPLPYDENKDWTNDFSGKLSPFFTAYSKGTNE
jgi:hypothetical protein